MPQISYSYVFPCIIPPIFLQAIQFALLTAETKVTELTAASTANASTLTTLQASTFIGKGLILAVHILYLFVGLVVCFADELAKLAARL